MKFVVLLLVILGSNISSSQSCFESFNLRGTLTDVYKGVIFNETLASGAQYTDFNIAIDGSSDIGIDTVVLKTYFAIEQEETSLKMSTTDAFDDFSRLAYATTTMITLQVAISCVIDQGSTSSNVILFISDSYSHSPEFGEELYVYNLPMPIMPKIDITGYGELIQVTEINFSNQNMSFAVTPDDFDIEAVQLSNKVFRAAFSANKILQLTENTTYILTAKNSAGNETEVPITIVVDTETGLDSPLFEKAYYSYDYLNGVLEEQDGVITVNSSKLNTSTHELVGDYKDHFIITLDIDSGVFDLKLGTPLSTTVKGQILLTLTYTTDSKTTTALLINIVEIVPLFNSHVYQGVYIKANDTIQLNDDVQISNALAVTVDDAVQDLFTINRSVDETDYFTIEPSRPLDELDFDENSNIIFTLTATSTTDSEAEAVVLLSLQTEDESGLQFEEVYFKAAYEVVGGVAQVTFDADSQIGFKNLTDFTNIDISVDAPYNENFSIGLSGSNWVVTVNGQLNSTTLNDNTQLLVPITATKTGLDATAKAVLVLSLPEKIVIKFEELFYTAKYILGDEDDSDFLVLDKAIKFSGAEKVDNLEFKVEGYEDFLTVSYHPNNTCTVEVIQGLEYTQSNFLTVTITATATDDLTTQTVLVVDLTSNITDSQIFFEKQHYAAQYILDSESKKGSVNLTEDQIKLEVLGDLSPSFEIEGFNDYFDLTWNEDTFYCEILIVKELENSTLANSRQLVMTITASAGELISQTVLILDLPISDDANLHIEFDKTYYTAQYLQNSSGKDVVNLTDDSIKLDVQEDLNVVLSLDDFKENFDLEFNEDSSSYAIVVIKNLDDEVLSNSTQLYITVTATANAGLLTTHTVVVLNLPIDQNALTFENAYYSAFYKPNSVKLSEEIVLKAEDFSNLQFSFQDFDSNFEIEALSEQGHYNVKAKEQLDDSLLDSLTDIHVVLTATDSKSKGEAATVLALKLPLYLNSVFDSEYYDAEYLKNDGLGLDIVNVNPNIKITNPEFTQFSVLGYEDKFLATCNSTNLECSIEVISNLNATSLSSTELFLTLVASTADEYSVGKSLLLLKLPSTNATFAFQQQFYRATYSIQSSEDDLGTVSLLDAISLEGAYDNDLSIISDEYFEYFKFELTSTGWNLELLKNLEPEVLRDQSELITTLTAANADNTAFAKAALIVKLPNASSIAFDKLQYFGDYISDGSPNVVLEENITTSASDNSEISVGSFSELLRAVFDNSKWTIEAETLNSTVLSKYSELNTELTIVKIGVSYGKAALTIRLPDLEFSKDVYVGKYSPDDQNVSDNITEQIELPNAHEDFIEVSLTSYAEYFKVELSAGVCTVTLNKPLDADIIDNYGVLVTSLVATRKSDGRTLATASLMITLLDENSTESPAFAQFAFYGDYINSDPPTVVLEDFIQLAPDNQMVIESVQIESSASLATSFAIQEEDYNNYIVQVVDPLSSDILDNLTSIVFTLVATSNQGKEGYAALVIALPKSVRNVSVQVVNQEILFSGVYGTEGFSSPEIPLEFTNSAGTGEVTVDITNELGIDNQYFHSVYSAEEKLLRLQIDSLPDDIVSNTSVIPLKLSITDVRTQDTIFAVMNVQIENGVFKGAEEGKSLGLIVSVSILAVLLALLLLAAFAYWFFKIRNTKYVEMTNEEPEPPTKTTMFTKNEVKKPAGGLSTVQLRRPTGLGVGVETIPEDASSDNIEEADDSLDLERKVVFNDDVQHIDGEEETPGMQSIADRRPTKFVFGYPLEKGIFDNESDERRESTDYNTDIPEERRRSLDLADRPKTVAFDEQVERMDIDPVEDDEDLDSDTSDGPDEEANKPELYRSEAELQIKDEGQLPSQIFKEIF